MFFIRKKCLERLSNFFEVVRRRVRFKILFLEYIQQEIIVYIFVFVFSCFLRFIEVFREFYNIDVVIGILIQDYVKGDRCYILGYKELEFVYIQ